MPTTTAGHTHILTAIDVYSRYLFAVPIKNTSANAVVDGLTSIFARHANLPTEIMTDKKLNLRQKCSQTSLQR